MLTIKGLQTQAGLFLGTSDENNQLSEYFKGVELVKASRVCCSLGHKTMIHVCKTLTTALNFFPTITVYWITVISWKSSSGMSCPGNQFSHLEFNLFADHMKLPNTELGH